MRLTRKGFEAWLKDQPSEKIVGTPGYNMLCPLAAYLQDQGDLDASVSYVAYWVNEKSHDSPAWARRFTKAADATGIEPITARRALELLGAKP